MPHGRRYGRAQAVKQFRVRWVARQTPFATPPRWRGAVSGNRRIMLTAVSLRFDLQGRQRHQRTIHALHLRDESPGQPSRFRARSL